MEENKICFVIMGFGKKPNSRGQIVDLDKTYKNIIKPAVEESGYTCVRADEIDENGIIDESMYALLIYADLVIADVTTYNPNAIYELGVRHAVRPYTTIILKQNDEKLDFDISHNRVISYTHLGEDIGVDEAQSCKDKIIANIKNIGSQKIDSPMFTYIRGCKKQNISDDEYRSVIQHLGQKQSSLFAYCEEARNLEKYANNNYNDNFRQAARCWGKALELKEKDEYIIQQLALCTYKSEYPSELSALTEAYSIIKELLPTNNAETLGIAGAICKNMYLKTEDIEYIKKACDFYQKGYMNEYNYYTGENYALCLNIYASLYTDIEEKNYYKMAAKKTRLKIIEVINNVIENMEEKDIYWEYATLANCYFGLHENSNAEINENKFMEKIKDHFHKETYLKSKKLLLKYL